MPAGGTERFDLLWRYQGQNHIVRVLWTEMNVILPLKFFLRLVLRVSRMMIIRL
jgi:hypothetical protein